jgi:hypothetical protein
MARYLPAESLGDSALTRRFARAGLLSAISRFSDAAATAKLRVEPGDFHAIGGCPGMQNAVVNPWGWTPLAVTGPESFSRRVIPT